MSYVRRNNLFEESGIGSYVKSGDWSWQFDPPPYDFLAPADSVAMPAPILFPPAAHGVGDCGCGGSCGGCHSHQVGAGLGLFDSMDFTTWGVGEWGAIALAAYLLIKVMSDTKKVAKRVRSSRAKRRRKQQLKQQLASM